MKKSVFKALIFLLFFFVVFQSLAQNNVSVELGNLLEQDSILRSTNEQTGRAEICEQIAIYYYQNDPEKSIPYFEEASNFYERVGDYKKSGYCVQNAAFAYDEKLGNYHQAIDFAERALTIWTANNDSFQIANMVKYIGLLKGKIGEYSEAREKLRLAAERYRMLGFDSGLAVTYFDLALVDEKEGQIDSSLSHLNLAKNIWRSQGNPDMLRIFIANNALLRLYLVKGEWSFLPTILEENEQQAPLIHWQHALEFYRLGIACFEGLKDMQSIEKYRGRLNDLENRLRDQGIKF